MNLLLGLVLLSALITAVLAVPFIDLLYFLKFQRRKEVHILSPIFTKLHAWKVGTPNSGGVLVILVILILGGFVSMEALTRLLSPITLIFLTLIGYGALGLYDDIKKYFGWQKKAFWGMRLRYKLIIQILLALGIGSILFTILNVGGKVPLDTFYFGTYYLEQWAYILFAATTIVAAVNAINITDGLDGMATGLLSMSIISLLVISLTVGDISIAQILAIWLGAMLAFLYFNIYPARVWMGDSGALAYGGALAVVALLLNVPLLLLPLGAVYVVETVSSLIQLASMKFWHKRVFQIAPLHHHFEALGWPETKVTMRFWLAGSVASILGLFIFFSSRNL